MPSKLFRVEIKTEIVVLADGFGQAVEVADAHIPDICDWDILPCHEVQSAGDLPPGWDDTCLPWGLPKQDDRTISELLQETLFSGPEQKIWEYIVEAHRTRKHRLFWPRAFTALGFDEKEALDLLLVIAKAGKLKARVQVCDAQGHQVWEDYIGKFEPLDWPADEYTRQTLFELVD